MDLLIKADPANAEATYAALAEFGAPLGGIHPNDFTDSNGFFRFGRDPKGFDILPAIPGVDLTPRGKGASRSWLTPPPV
jgi:hypothetical protein